MKKYVVMKLISGQEIIGKISARKKQIDSYEVEDPLLIISSILDNGSTVVLLRQYATMSPDRMISIQKSHVTSSFSPKPIFIEYYEVMLSYIEKYIDNDIEGGMKSAITVIKNMNESKSSTSKKKESIDDLFDYYLTTTKSNKNTH